VRGAVAQTMTSSDVGKLVTLVAGIWQLHAAAVTELYMKEQLAFMPVGVLSTVDEQAHTGQVSITGPAARPGAKAGDIWFVDVDGQLTNSKPTIAGTKLRCIVGRSWKNDEITVGVFFLSGPTIVNETGGSAAVDPETLRIDALGTDAVWGAAAGNDVVFGTDGAWAEDATILWNTVYGTDNAWGGLA
jgi:hypothetical protein